MRTAVRLFLAIFISILILIVYQAFFVPKQKRPPVKKSEDTTSEPYGYPDSQEKKQERHKAPKPKPPKETKERLEKLKKTINHYRYLYHVLDKQEISDEALDSLKDELFKIEQKYPELIKPD